MITEEQKKQIRNYFNSNTHIIEYEVFGEHPNNVQSIEELNNILENKNLRCIRCYEITPYNNINELLEDSKNHGPYVIKHNGHIYYLITSIYIISETCNGLVLDGQHNSRITTKELSKGYKWQDGNACGKLKLDFVFF